MSENLLILKIVNHVLADDINQMRTSTFYMASGHGTQIFGGLLLLAFLYGINRVLATPISLTQTIILTLLYVSAFIVWMQFYHLLALRRFLQAAGLLVLMLLAVGPYVYLCIYYLLPWMGEPLHRADVPFDAPQFFGRLVSGMVVTAISAGIFFLIRILRLRGRQRKAALKSHFVRNLLTMTQSYASTRPGPGAATATREMMGLVEYTLWIAERELTLVDWRNEWAQLVRLAALQETIRGSIVLKLHLTAINMPAMIPPLVWLTLVENALIHGAYATDQPIRVILRHRARSLYFHCINDYTDASRSRQGTGRGWKEVRQRMAEHYAATEWGWKIRDSGTRYHIVLMTGVPATG